MSGFYLNYRHMVRLGRCSPRDQEGRRDILSSLLLSISLQKSRAFESSSESVTVSYKALLSPLWLAKLRALATCESLGVGQYVRDILFAIPIIL